jgi:hypothetical protein
MSCSVVVLGDNLSASTVEERNPKCTTGGVFLNHSPLYMLTINRRPKHMTRCYWIMPTRPLRLSSRVFVCERAPGVPDGAMTDVNGDLGKKGLRCVACRRGKRKASVSSLKGRTGTACHAPTRPRTNHVVARPTPLVPTSLQSAREHQQPFPHHCIPSYVTTDHHRAQPRVQLAHRRVQRRGSFCNFSACCVALVYSNHGLHRYFRVRLERYEDLHSLAPCLPRTAHQPS